MIISAFPAIGKTYAYNRMKNIKGLKVFDSDSSRFSWLYRKDEEYEMKNRGKDDYIERKIKVRNPQFPNNYIAHIKENIDPATYMFVSSHKTVREALQENGIPYTLVYPRRDMLCEFIGRCFLRGNDEWFIKNLIGNWDVWIDSCENDIGAADKWILGSNEYLLDLIRDMSHK